MTKQLLKGGRVLDPSQNLDKVCDVLIEDGKIAAISDNISTQVDEIIELTPEHWVTPGLVDVHVHFRDPGQTAKETTLTGAAAAIAGGFTTVCIMPNTQPRLDNLSTLHYVNEQASKTDIQIYPVCAISKNLEGKELTEMGKLKAEGAIGFTDDGHGVQSAQLMKLALEYAAMLDLPVVAHSEDDCLSGCGVMNEGYYSTLLGLPGVPNTAESAMVARDIELVRQTGGRLHVAHVSTRETVNLIRKAQAEGLPVTGETTPHYLALTDANVQGYDPDFKMNAPLRTADDQQIIKDALLDGTLACIATDHAPHTTEEKRLSFDEAPNGVIGLETSVGVTLGAMYHTGLMTPLAIINAMSTKPAEIFRLNAGSLKPGSQADVTIIDPNQQWVVDVSEFKSKSKNCPFKGQTLTGRAVMTMAKGKVLMNALKQTATV